MSLAKAEPPPQWADAPATSLAQAAFDRGVELANAKRFTEARGEFKASFQMAPSRSALFAWAQAERLSGNCAEAEPLYQWFLQNTPESEQQEAARLALRRCEQTAKVPEAAPLPQAPPQQPISLPPAGPPERHLWPFVATGTALVVAGAVVLLVSRLEENAANDAQTYQTYRDARGRVQTEQIVGLSAAGLGAVTLGLTAWLGRRSTEAPPQVSLWLLEGSSAGAVWKGRF